MENTLPGIQKNILLKDFTTYKIGGPAKYFFSAQKTEEIIDAIKFAKQNKLPVFILGGGSNILVSDKGFKGLVIKISGNKIITQDNLIICDAGLKASKLVSFAAENGYGGFEWVSGIPGATVGGCIFGNAQAFGAKISDNVKFVDALDLKTLKIKRFTKDQCKFSLKNSIFKKTRNLIIITVAFEIKKEPVDVIEEKIKNFLNYRKTKHPMGLPSAGSTFVNPEKKIKNKKLLEKYPELNDFNQKGTIASGYLIEKCGLAGKKIGGAEISLKHANFIINVGGAKAKDVATLIKLARQKVKKVFGIDLEVEVQFVGF